MGFETNFLKGWATYLATAGVGVYSTTDPYQPTDVAITFTALPQDPDNAIALGMYTVSDDPTLSDSVLALQVYSRAAGPDPTAVEDIGAAVYEQLQGLSNITLATGVKVLQVVRQGGGSLGRDENQRWERSDNYYVTVHRPSLRRQ